MARNLALVFGAFSVSRRARNRRLATTISIIVARRLQEVDRLFAAVPDHRRLRRLGARDDLAAAQHELARRDQPDRVHLGRRGEDAEVGPAARLQPVALEAEGARPGCA